MKPMAAILVPAAIAAATAAVALPAGLGFDGISPPRVCQARFDRAESGGDAAESEARGPAPAPTRYGGCAARLVADTDRS